MSHSYFPSSIKLGIGQYRRIEIRPLPPKKIIYEKIGEYHSWIGYGDCDDCIFNLESPNSYGVSIDCGYDRPINLRPYSLRSFIIQLCLLTDFPCKLFISNFEKDEFGNEIWYEGCTEKCNGCNINFHKCHLINGWKFGKYSCLGWDFLCKIFDSNNEKRFLDLWLRINSGKETPMPIPQIYIDDLQRIRADFVLYLPENIKNELSINNSYDWIIIELDSPFISDNGNKDKARDNYLRLSGYKIIHILPKGNMWEQVRKLYADLIMSRL